MTRLMIILIVSISPVLDSCLELHSGENKSLEFPITFEQADSAILAGEFGTIHSLLIQQNGVLIFEKYYNHWNPDSLHPLQSATKTVVAALLGCAIQQRFIGSENDLIGDYLPEGYCLDSMKRHIRIKDLLTQQHGLRWNEGAWEDTANSWRKIINTKGNWYKAVLATAMDTLPGTKFVYSNAAPLLVAGIIQWSSKMRIEDFAKRFLFGPLGIEQNRFWQGNGGPSENGMAMLSLSSRDMIKIGQLFLQEGVWNDQQLIPKQFSVDAISAKVSNVGRNGVYQRYDYGYFWWINPVLYGKNEGLPVFMARGAGGQNIIVWPERKWVLVITAWNRQQPNKPQSILDKYPVGD
ncbi:MAG: serine hydrolase [Terrimonas sp.]|nr:serine hydrolase [Terrimonas sp.]